MYRNQSPMASVMQTVIFLVILGGLLFVGFYLFVALLPIILIFIAYIWYKYRKTMKAFREAQANGTYNQNFDGQSPFGSSGIRFIRINNGQFSEQDFSQEENQSRIHEHTVQNDNADKKQENAVVYDISPEDYSIEEKKK